MQKNIDDNSITVFGPISSINKNHKFAPEIRKKLLYQLVDGMMHKTQHKVFHQSTSNNYLIFPTSCLNENLQTEKKEKQNGINLIQKFNDISIQTSQIQESSPQQVKWQFLFQLETKDTILNTVNLRKKQLFNILQQIPKKIENQVTFISNIALPVTQQIALNYQESYIANFKEQLLLNEKNCLLYIGTGMGKTKIALFCCKEYEQYFSLFATIDIVVTTKALQKQWLKQLEELFGKEFITNHVQLITASQQEKKKINIYTIQRITKLNEINCDILILDEVHLYRSGLYSKVFFESKYNYLLGLSATPFSGMSNNEINQFIIGMMFSVVITNLETKQIENIGSKIVYKVKYINNEQQEMVVVRKDGIVSMQDSLKLIQADVKRAELICQIIKQCLKRQRRIFVFCVLKDYIRFLCTYFAEKYPKYAKQIIELHGDISTKKQEIANKQIQELTSVVVFTTYKYSSVGLDLPDMDTIILADSVKSQLEQIIGRIGRAKNKEQFCEIYDVVDIYHFVKKHFYDRKKVYTKKNYQICNYG